MAKRIFLRKTNTVPSAVPQNAYEDASEVAGNVGEVTVVSTLTTNDANGERPFGMAGLPMAWWSERVAAEITIAGTITFNMFAKVNTGLTGRLRVRLSKITIGGSDVETLIATADAGSDLTTTVVAYNFSLAPPQAVTAAYNERFLLRVSVINPVGSATAELHYSGGTSAAYSWWEFTEAVTVRPNGTTLYPRDTSANGIGNFFDLLDVRGAASVTGVVNTVASGTQIQWTRTAGGTLLEWISPRLRYSWSVTSNGSLVVAKWAQIWAEESATAANCGNHVKMFRRKADSTEILVFSQGLASSEMTTNPAAYGPNGFDTTLSNATVFEEDDRIIIRWYIVNVGTMGGARTCTLTYNGPTTGAAGDAWIKLLDMPEFKLESDPAYRPIPSGLAMTGMGT